MTEGVFEPRNLAPGTDFKAQRDRKSQEMLHGGGAGAASSFSGIRVVGVGVQAEGRGGRTNSWVCAEGLDRGQ